MSDKTRMGTEHRWAHNDDPCRRRTGSGHLTFEGLTAFSYRTAVAHKYPDRKGGGTAVFAGAGIWNSSMTTKDKSKLRHALTPDWKVLHVDVSPEMGTNHRYGTPADEIRSLTGLRKIHDWQKKHLQELAEQIKTAKNYRSRARLYQYDFIRLLEGCNGLGAFLHRKAVEPVDFGIRSEDESANVAKADECRDRPVDMSPAAVARREKAAAYRAGEYGRKLQKWRDGETHQCPGKPCARGDRWRSTYNDPIPLRLRKIGDEWQVQTARSVTMPVSHALMAYRVSLLARKGVDVSALKGRHISNFTVNEAKADGSLRVGCHVLAGEEMDLLFVKAKELGALTPTMLKYIEKLEGTDEVTNEEVG